MEDQRSAEGVEHLQAAARELLLAARSFLSVVEEVVEDRDRFAGAAAGVADLLRDGLAGAMPPTSPLQPWEQAAWAGAASPDDVAPDDSATDDSSTDDSSTDDSSTDDGASDGEPPLVDAPSPSPVAPAAGPPRRVRRIAVD